MGDDKLLLMYKEKTLLQRAIELLSGLPVYEKIIVSAGAWYVKLKLPPDVRLLVNPCPEIGQSGSVRLGLEAATGTHYLFLAADQPKLSPADLIPILELAESNPDKIIFPVIDKKPNSPTLFPAFFRTELLGLTGDSGGRPVRDSHPEVCFSAEPEHPENFTDIDCLEDYQALI